MRPLDGWTGFQVVSVALGAPKHRGYGYNTSSIYHWKLQIMEVRATRKDEYVWSLRQELKDTDETVLLRQGDPAPPPPPEVVALGTALAAERGLAFNTTAKHNKKLDPLEILSYIKF